MMSKQKNVRREHSYQEHALGSQRRPLGNDFGLDDGRCGSPVVHDLHAHLVWCGHDRALRSALAEKIRGVESGEGRY